MNRAAGVGARVYTARTLQEYEEVCERPLEPFS